MSKGKCPTCGQRLPATAQTLSRAMLSSGAECYQGQDGFYYLTRGIDIGFITRSVIDEAFALGLIERMWPDAPANVEYWKPAINHGVTQ